MNTGRLPFPSQVRASSLLDRQGVTLVELLISAAIFGVAALAMTSLFGMHAQRVNTLRNDSSLSESASSFFDALEGVLSSATHIAYCGCSQSCVLGNSPDHPIITDVDKNCYHPEGGALANCDTPNAGAVKRLLLFETEDAVSPGDPVPQGTSVCFASGSVGTQGQLTPADSNNYGMGLILRGCKRWMRLSFEAPSGNPTTTPVLPGKLSLHYLPSTLASSTATTPAGSILLAQLEGVYRVWCGMNLSPPSSGPNASPAFGRGDTFTLIARAKSRARNDNSPANFEPWGPVDGTGVPAPLLPRARAAFQLGTHRTFVSETEIMNIGARGLMVGKVQSSKGCARDGASGSGLDCCSGYFSLSGTTRTCISSSACVSAGGAATNTERCCSHMGHATSGVCL